MDTAKTEIIKKIDLINEALTKGYEHMGSCKPASSDWRGRLRVWRMYYCVIKIRLGIKDGMMEMIYYPETRMTVTTATTSTATTRTEET